jgi:hypothetical protein
MKWDYAKQQVHLYMPDYVKKALIQYDHQINKRQNQPSPHTPIQYGSKKIHQRTITISPTQQTRQEIHPTSMWKFLFLGQAVDSTLLTPISAIASQSAEPTEETVKQTKQLLDYLATQEEAVLTYNKSNMILAIHSDASYLSEPKARSRAGGHFFLSYDTADPPTMKQF